MVSETGTFGGATVLTIVGLVIMLYGVSLNNGMAFNTEMIAGFVVIGAGILLVVVGVMDLDDPHAAE